MINPSYTLLLQTQLNSSPCKQSDTAIPAINTVSWATSNYISASLFICCLPGDNHRKTGQQPICQHCCVRHAGAQTVPTLLLGPCKCCIQHTQASASSATCWAVTLKTLMTCLSWAPPRRMPPDTLLGPPDRRPGFRLLQTQSDNAHQLGVQHRAGRGPATASLKTHPTSTLTLVLSAAEAQ